MQNLKVINNNFYAALMVGLWRSQVAHRTLNPAVVGSNPSRPAVSDYIRGNGFGVNIYNGRRDLHAG